MVNSKKTGSVPTSAKRPAVNLDSDDDCQIIEEPVPPRKKPKVSASSQVPPTATHGPAPTTLNPSVMSFGVSVDAHKDLRMFFPSRTLDINADIYRDEIQAVMHAYQNSQSLELQYRYTVIEASAVGSGTEFTVVPCGDPTPSKAFANARLLDQFTKVYPGALSDDKPAYVWMTTKTGIKNPKFAHLHAVRYGEVGCGFDEDGCLSMYVTQLVGGDRQNNALYVQRDRLEEMTTPRVVDAEARAAPHTAEVENIVKAEKDV